MGRRSLRHLLAVSPACLLHGWADNIVFDPKRVRDYSAYQRPHRWSDGIDWVLVNGEIEMENGKLTDRRAGRVMLKNEARKEGGAR